MLEKGGPSPPPPPFIGAGSSKSCALSDRRFVFTAIFAVKNVMCRGHVRIVEGPVHGNKPLADKKSAYWVDGAPHTHACVSLQGDAQEEFAGSWAAPRQGRVEGPPPRATVGFLTLAVLMQRGRGYSDVCFRGPTHSLHSCLCSRHAPGALL